MKRVAIYIRVSTQEQREHGMSVDSQLSALQQYCKDNNYKIVGIFNDAGISAHIKYTHRPELLKMIQCCQEKKVDLVLFTKLDRFFRSVQDYYACVSQMNNVPWKAIWEDYETETSSGIFKVNIMLSIAQAESDRTSERIKAVFDYKRQQGNYVGTAPLGYKREDKKRLVIDEEKREIVAGFFECYLTTFNIRRCNEYLLDHGISRTRKTIRLMLRNPTYKGDALGSECEPYITQEQHDLIVNSFRSRTRTSRKLDIVYIFSGGILRCARCGATLSSHCHKKDGKNYKYYECSRGSQYLCTNSKSTSERVIEKKVLAMVEDKLNEHNVSIKSSDKVVSINTAKIERLKLKLNRIGDRYEEGEISYDEYIEKKNAVKSEIDSLSHVEIKKKKSLPENWRELYSSFDDTHKRALWMSLFDRIEMDHKGNIDLFF